MSQKIKVLLTGAGSSIGRNILKTLLVHKEQFDITAFDVKKGKTMNFLEHFKAEVKVIYGDLAIPEESIEATTDKDFVIHCGYLSESASNRNPRLAQKINVMGTRYLVENLECYSPSCFLAMISTVGVYGDRLRSPMITVGDFTAPSIGDSYALSLLQAEKFVQDSRLEWTIFRPGIVLDTEESFLDSTFFKMPLTSHLEFVHIRDLTFAVVSSYERRASLWNRTFNVGGGDLCREIYQNFVQRLIKIAGWGDIDFPERSFATYNRYGGYFSDGDALEEIMHFRAHTLEHFFEELQKSQTLISRLTTKVFGDLQKKNFLAQSEPYKAFKQNDEEKLRLYF